MNIHLPTTPEENNNYKFDSTLLNTGLSLALEFAEHQNQPIQHRLSQFYPELTSEQLDKINHICYSASQFGSKVVYRMAEAHRRGLNQDEAAKIIKIKYPWIDNVNVEHLISQAMYFVK